MRLGRKAQRAQAQSGNSDGGDTERGSLLGEVLSFSGIGVGVGGGGMCVEAASEETTTTLAATMISGDKRAKDDSVDYDHDEGCSSPPDLTGSSQESSSSSSSSSQASSSSSPRDYDAVSDLPLQVTSASESDGSSRTSESDACEAEVEADQRLDDDDDVDDPYSDVRERMERLSAEDRAELVLHRYHSHRSRRRRRRHGRDAEDAIRENGATPAATLTGAVEPSPSKSESSHGRGRCRHVVDESTIPFFAAVTTYVGYAVLIFVGHIRDVCANIFRSGRYLRASSRKCDFPSDDLRLYAPLLKSWENFYTRRLYHRIQDCFNRPISSRPCAIIDVLERVSSDGNKTMRVLGRGTDAQRAEYESGRHYIEAEPGGRVARRCLNLGSYNYLGFADDWDVTCREEVLGSLRDFPVSSGSSRLEFGTTSLHAEVEKLVAEFLGKEAAVCLNMGFNTNATAIPALATKGDLLVSDELNHTSIVNGARASGASIRTFRHNDAAHLEEILRTAIVMGRPRTRRPWNRILVVVEGVYSMEGEYCDLPSVVSVCKRYGAYVYLDEAHSIGAMGLTGRGCCEYTGVDTADVDLLMGTFTKSFGGMGGYIAGSKEVIGYLREWCAGSSYHNSLSPVVCQQIISSFKVIMGRDGTDIGKRKLSSLRDNSNYFRMRLTDMGLHVLGNYDSPIMPVMLYNPTKIAAFSRECLKRGLAVVVVGFPAVPVLMSRARFCISAGHTRKELDWALGEIEEIADLLKLRYARFTFG